MSFHAQRGEDIRLVKYLAKFGIDPTKQLGRYIDVGAWEPTLDSVTKYFYDLGWSGINIEPVPFYFQKLEAERPRDINLNIAISDHNGSSEMFVFEGSGLSTLCDDFKENAFGFPRETVRVKTKTLESVCWRHFGRRGDDGFTTRYEFLKIDVEGYEREVLIRNDWSYRPRVIVIEATKPGTDIPNWDAWDSYVQLQDYKFVEFDGLNRWYLDGR